ncbi:uncharacterized protein LOC103515326 isoform X3 [Diaphorina citri]|uniref:Uncharacterized protein LOC103515326 isoform X3 n=1 Tax=Diaphorina citri TaxID=121845 RepID=A0A3Q0JA80_DIACI|nr:uncharacterized protein LOC103515326 isoform X3 [Diaphorina citri]
MSFSKTAASSSSSINPSTPSSNNNTSSSSINTSSVNPLTSSSNTTSSINPLTSVGLVHFMIPYLLKDHPHFARILFGSDAILARILAELAGPNMEEAVSCIEELMSGMLPLRDERRAVRPPCGGKCAPAQVTYEGDLTFLLDDGSTLKANRELLIHKSLYFETMLCGNFKECDQKSNIKLSNISAPCLETLLRLIAHYCTCVLLRIDIGVYLELIVKSDEYLLHELNYNLIELLYTSHAIITATNVHLVYRWSLNYNEFVQACVSNYENFFSKNEHEPRGGAKRMRMEVEEKEDVKRAKTGDDSGRGKNKEEAKERIEDNGLGKNKEETEYGRKKNKEEAKDRIENSGFGKEEEVKERIDNNGLGKNKEEAKDRSDVSGTAVEKSCEENVKNIDGLTRMSLSDNKDSDKASRDRDKAGKDSDKVCKDSDKARGSNNATGINNATTTNKDSEKVVKKSPENAPLASDQPSCSYHLENVERMEIDEIDMKETLGNSEIDKVKHDKPEDIREKLDKVEKGMETGENIGNKAEVKKYVERLEGNVPDKIKVSENVEIFENVSDNTKVSKHVERLENVPGKERISECEELLKNNVLEKEEIGEDVDMPEEKAGNEMKLSKDEEILERNDEELLEGNQSKDRDLLENIPDKEEINEEVELLDESGVDDAQPCLISDLINEINKNKNALGKSPGTPMAVNVQNNIEQGKDEIKNILLLKNEPSFKLRKLPLAAKKHRLPTTHSSTSSTREDLNVFLIKLIFSQSGRSSVRKSVEVVRNIIGMSQEGDEDIFEQFKYDIHEFIRENLK